MYAHLLPRSGDEILATCRDWRHIINAMANREVNKARMLINAHVIRYAIYAQEISAQQGQKLSDILLNF
jgi:DNA-binding GntR family transcriptional regulator